MAVIDREFACLATLSMLSLSSKSNVATDWPAKHSTTVRQAVFDPTWVNVQRWICACVWSQRGVSAQKCPPQAPQLLLQMQWVLPQGCLLCLHPAKAVHGSHAKARRVHLCAPAWPACTATHDAMGQYE